MKYRSDTIDPPAPYTVEVFKTNVQSKLQSQLLIRALCSYFPEYKINFDLEDCDRILRVEGAAIDPEKIILILQAHVCECSVLEH